MHGQNFQQNKFLLHKPGSKLFLTFTYMLLALLTDIHEDLESLKSALHKIEKLKVDQIACLGDMVGFSVPYHKFQDTRNASECLNLIKSNCEYIVLGNHDMHAAKIIPKYSDIFDFPEKWYQLSISEKQELCNDQIWLPELDELDPFLNSNDIEYLRSLPEYHIIESMNGNLILSHYLYPNLSGLHKTFYFEPSDYKQHIEFVKSKNCRFSFVGHQHFEEPWLASERHGNLKNIKKNLLFPFTKRQKLRQSSEVQCIGVLPTVQNTIAGFCIFDTEQNEIKYYSL